MSITTLAVTGTVYIQNATAFSGAMITMELSDEISDGVKIIYPNPVSVTTASDGTFSFSGMNANDDSTTVPAGTYYKVTLSQGETTFDSFNVILPNTASPTVDLFSLTRYIPMGLTYAMKYAKGTK